MSITNELIDECIVIKNFAKINILFYKFFNKKETKQILQIFKIYDGNNNESLYVKNFLDLVDGFFNIEENEQDETIDEGDVEETKEENTVFETKEIETEIVNVFDEKKAYEFLNNTNENNFTMYNYLIQKLRSGIVKNLNEAHVNNDFDSISILKDSSELISKIYDEDKTIFDIMLVFFKDYFLSEIFSKNCITNKYATNIEKTIKTINENTLNKEEAEKLYMAVTEIEIKLSQKTETLIPNYLEYLSKIKLMITENINNFQSDIEAVKETIEKNTESTKQKINDAITQIEISKNINNYNINLEKQKEELAKSSLEKLQKDRAELSNSIQTISDYTSKYKIDNNNDNNISSYTTNFDNFFNNFLKCMETGQKQYLDNMENIMKEDIDELKIPYTFYYKTIWYVLAILGTGVFTTTNLKKSQENIRKIKDFDWSVEIKNKSGEEIFKDKFWKYLASYANYMNEGYSQYNTVLKDKGFLNMQKCAVEASKILSSADDKEIENIKKEIHKIFYEKIDFGIYTLYGGLYGATQNVADLMYELCSPIELTFNKNITASFFEEMKNASLMCVKGAAIEAIYFMCFNKFDFLGNCSLFDLINKLRYYNEIMKNAATLKIENQSFTKTNIILQSEEYLDNVKNGFGVFNDNPKIKNSCFWFIYKYIQKRNTLLGFDFRSTDSIWWRQQISNLNDKESAFVYLAYLSVFAKKKFDASIFLQSYNETLSDNLEFDDVSKKTYNNIDSFFGLNGYSNSEFNKLGSEFINKGVLKSVFTTEQLVNFYSLQINENNKNNIMPLSFKTFSNKCESEFSYFFIEISSAEREFIDNKLSTFNDDTSVFLMRFAPTIQLLLKNIPSFSSIINLDNIINKFESTINSLMLFVNDSLNRLYNDLTSIENKYVLEMANKKYYYMAQSVPIAIDYIYKIIISSNFSFATLINQMEKSTIDFEDIEELDKIQNSIDNHLNELQKSSTNSSIVVNNISSIKKEDYYAVKKLINNLSEFQDLYVDNNEVVFYTNKNNTFLTKNFFGDSEDSEYSKKIFIETIKEYVEISESDLKILIEQKSVKDFIERKINNSETINKKISSYTTTKISIEDLKKSIKDNYVKKQIYGTKNIIEISNEAKQEKINLRFDLYK